MQAIKNWLSGSRNFYVGKVLVKTFCRKNKDLLNLIENGYSEHTVELMANALADFLQQPEPVIENTETVTMPNSEDVVLKAIKDEWMPLFQEMNMLRHNLQKFGNSNAAMHINTRKKMAFEILDLEQKVNQCWEKRNYYITNKKLPENKDDNFTVPEDTIQRATAINATTRRIRDWRLKLNRNPTNVKAANEITKYKLRYKVLTGKEYEGKDYK